MTRLRRMVSNILAVAYRETLVLRHDRGFMTTVTAQPVMMLLLFGFALSYTPANVPWAVLDRSTSAQSRRLVEEIRGTGYFLEPTPIQSYAQGRELLRRGDALAVLVIPRDFRRDFVRGRPQVQLLLDGTDPITAARLLGYLTQIAAASDIGRHIPRDRGAERARVPIDVRQRFWFNPTLRDRDFFMAIMAGMLLTNLCLSGSALNIVGERESGTFEQTLSLPVSTLEIVLGKLLPLVGVCYLLLVVAVVGSGVGYGIWPRGGWLALGIVTLPFVLASLAMGVFVSTISALLGAGRVHHRVLHHAVVRALGRDVPVRAHAAAGARRRHGVPAALVPDRTARDLHARRQRGGGAGAVRGALHHLRRDARGDPLAPEAAPGVTPLRPLQHRREQPR